MSINAILSSAVSGLNAAQTGLRTVSDNIANVGTPGYVRKVVDQTSYAGGGVGSATVRLAADRFLQAANLSASARAGQAGAQSGLFDQAQSLFGDPSSDASFFSTLDGVFSAFNTLVSMPASSAARAGALGQVTQFFDQASVISSQLDGLIDQADRSINAGIDQANGLLQQIDDINKDIARSKASGGDVTGPENTQNQLIDQLSSLMDVKVSIRPQGGVVIRGSDGTMLAGEGAAKLSYDATAATGELSITLAGGQTTSIDGRLMTGQIRGLLDFRNIELPAMSTQLSELVSKTADQLNAVHNAYSAAPAPASLTGRNTNIDLPSNITGFTGKTTVALVDAAGLIQHRVDIDFTAGTMSADGGAAAAFTPATFLAGLNTALGANGSASFANGALTISATGANGVAIADDPTTPSAKAGRGFSAFFGMNDLIRSAVPSNYDTGLSAASLSNVTGDITLRISGRDGSRIHDITVTAPPGGTMGDLVNALNSPTSGVGLYGAFALDANGQLAFTPAAGSGNTLSVTQDGTTHTPGGLGISALFGIGTAARSARTGSFSIRSDIQSDPSRLALGKIDLTVAVGVSALSKGDVRGADALSQAGLNRMRFDATGDQGAVSLTLSDYSAMLSGSLGRKAATADALKTSAEAAGEEAKIRRSTAEGVNMDEELIKLTNYQQAYAASARMVQAVKDMYDTLLQMTN
ncbi:MAG: flagellar hook-associated protein FlgK [Caulobacteraceae bacterium]